MKVKVLFSTIVAALFATGLAFAQAEKEAAVAPVVVEQVAPASAVEPATPALDVEQAVQVQALVGNKICPVSGAPVAVMAGETVEYNGKVYNLCCPGCKEKFLADAEKFSKVAEDEVAKEVAAAVPVVPAPEVPAPAVPVDQK